MNGKKIVTIVLLLFVVASAVYLIAQESSNKNANPGVAQNSPEVPPQRVIAYYFHGNARCKTCLTLEAYAHEAIATGFPGQLDSGLVDWRVINTDLKENEHFVNDYGLTLQTVVLVQEKDGQQVAWKSLDKIWDLVGDKEAYSNYIQTELKDYLTGI